MLNTLAMAAMTFAIGGIAAWMPDYLSETRHIEQARANLVFGAIAAGGGLAATLLGGFAGDALRGKVRGAYFLVSAAGMLLAAPFVIAMLHLPFIGGALPPAWVALAIAVFFLFFNTGPSNTALANVTRPDVRATAFAVNILFIHLLGDVPAPALLGYITGKFSWNAAFGVVASVMVLAGVLWIAGARYLDGDTQRAEAVPA